MVELDVVDVGNPSVDDPSIENELVTDRVIEANGERESVANKVEDKLSVGLEDDEGEKESIEVILKVSVF